MKRNRISYIIILFLSLIYIYFDGGFLPYTLFYIVLLTPVVSFLYMLIVFNTFLYSEKLEKREYQKGEILNYSLKLENVTPFYIACLNVNMHMDGRILIRGMKNERLVLKPFSRQEFSFNVPIRYRGKYRVGITYIEIRDFLNLISLKYKSGETRYIRVYPRVLPVDELEIPYVRLSENEYLSRNKNTGHTEIRDIRDYMYGDSLKKIHWKLSSKFNKLMTKETTASSEKEFWVMLNLETISGDAENALKIEDRTIEVLVSLARVFLNSGVAIRLCFFKEEQECMLFSDMNGFAQLYELLAFISFDRKASFEDVMNYFIESMPERQSVMIFTPVVSENHLDCLHKMNANGHDVSLFYCEVSENGMRREVEKALAEEMPEMGIRVINMFTNMRSTFEKDNTEAV